MLSSTRASGTSDPAGAGRPVRALSHGAIGLRRVTRHRGAMVGAAVIGALLLCAVLAPYIARYDPNEPHFAASLRPPSAAFPLGTDSFGRDLLSRLVYGGRISLTVGTIAVILSFAAGVPLGVAAGYYGGRLDDVIMRVVDVWLAFPDLLLAIAIVAVLGPGLQNVMLAIGVSGIPGVCRLVRGSVLPVKEESYVEVARAVGGSEGRIIRTHILPNVLAPIVVLLTLRLGTAVLAGVGLSFLGLGVQPPTAEWGAMVSEGRSYLQQAWWVSTIPGIAIFLSVMAVNVLGDGLRDALDPRLH
ncbi:MAG TPA: ABC transporter permease [bacterium]|nr:ABC transporter permease [bacterium]